MQQFMRKFEQLDGIKAKVIIEHILFDKQEFICPSLKTISDNEKIGVLLKGHKIFMYKQYVENAEVQDNTYTISDGRLTLNINKL